MSGNQIWIGFGCPVFYIIVFVWSQFDGGKIDNRTIGLWFPPKPRRSQARDYGEETLLMWILTITKLCTDL